MFNLYFTYLFFKLFIHLFICNLLLTAVPIIFACLNSHLLPAGGNGLWRLLIIIKCVVILGGSAIFRSFTNLTYDFVPWSQ